MKHFFTFQALARVSIYIYMSVGVWGGWCPWWCPAATGARGCSSVVSVVSVAVSVVVSGCHRCPWMLLGGVRGVRGGVRWHIPTAAHPGAGATVLSAAGSLRRERVCRVLFSVVDMSNYQLFRYSVWDMENRQRTSVKP